ncbi:MAG: T9SS type A sorting domain-containing protein [Saprospiraceae bacterium]|nr:T9SS type A sorting domain-containing protein [Saprospiraceae bacterium]
MLRNFLFAMMILISYSASAQVRVLQEYIEEGHNYHKICKKAEKLIRKNKIENEAYREGEFRKKKSKDFLDDDKMKFERWKWYWRDRVNEDGSFPDLLSQWQVYNQVSNESRSVLSRNIPQWKHEGPVKNTGGYWGMGRTTHVSFHPSQRNTFYVASPNGGIWKTLDAGKTYTSIADNLPYQPVGIVLVNPENPNMLYATLGEKEGWWQYSMGVYKTTNGGTTWNPTSLNWKLSDNKVIFALQMNPQNPSILIAATSDGIYKTFNGGNAWVRIRTENFSDVIFKPGDTSVVYAASNDYWGNSNVFKSTDGGNTFSKVTEFGLQKVFLKFATTLADEEYLGLNMSVDGEKRFYLSKNSAQTFEFVSNMPENLVLYFSQNNKSILYSGYVVIYKSTDGGKNWNQITDWWASGRGLPEIHADHHFIGHYPGNRDEMYFGCDGGVYRYRESTETWDELVNGLAITQFYKMAISTTIPPVLIGGSQDNGGWVRRANGSWGNTNGGDAMTQILDPTNPNIGYTEYWGGNAVYRTTNGFNNLDDITQNIGASLPGQWVTPFNLNPQNPKTFIIGYNEVFVSHDRGNSFRKISNNLTGHIDNDLREVKISPVDTNFIAATRANTLYTSKDFGKTWKSSNLISNLDITGIEFHPKNGNRMWCTRGGLGAIKVMESNNQGTSWINITKNMVNTPVLCIAYDEAANTLFIGTDFGLFYSDADNIDWQYYGVGLPHTSVTDIELHQGLRKLYVSTYGRGFYSIDLPDCAPAQLNLYTQLNRGGFELIDSLKVCSGSHVVFKTQDLLKGNFRWRGPGFDTTLIDQINFDAGVFTKFQQNGNYILEYTSETGCKRIDTVYIRVIPRPAFKPVSNFDHLDCNHPVLTLSPGMNNDSLTFDFIWTSPNTDTVQSYNLNADQAGFYRLAVVNKSSSCAFQDSIMIIKFEDPVFDTTLISNNLCHGEANGQIQVFVSEGRLPYTYKWSNGIGTSSNTALAAGTYRLELTDANSCSLTAQFEITQPEAYQVGYMIKHTGSADGSILIDVQGNTAPYLFEWYKDGILISTMKDLLLITPGFYSLKILDANDCLYELKDLEVKELVGTSSPTNFDVEIFPNPAKNLLQIKIRSGDVKLNKIQLFDLQGRELRLKLKTEENTSATVDLSTLQTGRYLLRFFAGSQLMEYHITKSE